MSLTLTELIVELEGDLRHTHEAAEARYKNNIFEQANEAVHLDLDAGWQNALAQLQAWAQVNSPWAVCFTGGSARGCEVELLATLSPRRDLHHFGLKPPRGLRRAEVLICAGPTTKQARDHLLQVYRQMQQPKFVVAAGSCPASGEQPQGCEHIVGHIDEVIPADVYVPGCPPAPGEVADGLIKLLGSLKK